MDECCIHYESVKDAKLVNLSTIDSWKTLLLAARKRNYTPLLKIADETPSNAIPKLAYHKTCRSMFTLKRDLDKLSQSSSSKSKRTSRVDTSTSSVVLPKKCIFCNKESKYLTGQKTREKLVLCETFAADEKIRKVAFEKNDERI